MWSPCLFAVRPSEVFAALCDAAEVLGRLGPFLHDLHLRHTYPGEPQQVAVIASQATAIESAIRGVRLRLDAMRVILRRA